MGSTEKTYNGWTNYETWNVKLWMDNDEASYRYWQDIAEEIWNDCDRDEDSFRDKMAERLETGHSDNVPEEVRGTYADLLGTALQRVNWDEIAESFVEDLPKKEEEEEEEETK